MLEPAEIEAAIREAARGKTRRRIVRYTLDHIGDAVQDIRRTLEGGTWQPLQHGIQIIREGSHRKRRNIIKPAWYREQIIHHLLARQLARIYGPRMYFYAAGTVRAPGARKGKGPLFCMRTLRRWRDGYHGRRFYVAELDIRQFFDSVDTEILKGFLARRIRDKRFLTLLFKVIDGAAPGIPKGFYTSPWLAQIYLSEMDGFITQELHPAHYLRFVDNLFILSPNKRQLHRTVDRLRDWMQTALHLDFNGSRQIYRFEDSAGRGRAIDCTGYVIHRDRVTMRKGILKRARAKALRIRRHHRCTRLDAACMISYRGWFRHTDTYSYYEHWIRPNISMRYCRLKVARAARAATRRAQGGIA